MEIRAATADDDDAVLALLQASMGWVPDEQYTRFFAWKHRENPFGPSPAWVAIEDGRVVGFRTFLRWQFARDDATVDAVRAVDTATHPDYQGRGIFSKLTYHALDELMELGVAFVFNTPNDNSRPGYLKMGWRLVDRLAVAARPRSPLSLVRLARARTPADKWSTGCSTGLPAPEALADETAVATLLDRLGPRAPGGPLAAERPDSTRADVTNQPARADADTGTDAGSPRTGASAHADDGSRLRTRRSPGYLRWRYGFPPLRYRAVAAPGGLADGLVIFRLRRRGGATEAAICEVLVPGNDRGLTRRLLGQVLRGSSADHAVMLGPARPSLGFLPVPGQGPTLVWRAVGETTPPPSTGWDLALGDIELF
ncbi:MAG: GNAT family N-acetyltransferase [Acidimicrobiales bacterium]